MFWLYVLMGSFSAVDILIGLYVFSKNPSRPLNITFLLFAIGMSMIGLGMAFLFISHQLIFDKIIFFGGYLMVLGLTLLSIKFPLDSRLSIFHWISLAPLVVLILLIPSNLIIRGVVFRSDGILEPINGEAFGIFATIIGLYILSGMYRFWRKYNSFSGIHRLQMQYLGLGAGAFAMITMACNVILPFFGIFGLNMLGPISSIFFVVAVAYAIVNHRLLDVRLVIQRSTVYLILLTAVTCLYLASIAAAGVWFGRYAQASFTAGFITVCFGVLTVPRLEKYFEHITSKLFFKNTYDYSETLRNLSAILNRGTKTKRIISRASRILKDIFGATNLRIIIHETNSDNIMSKKWYQYISRAISEHAGIVMLGRQAIREENRSKVLFGEEYGIEIAAPIFLGRNLLGVILLGPKKSGDLYTNRDIDLVATFSCQAAVAIEKSKLFDKLKDYSKMLESRVRDRTADIKDMQEKQRQMMVDISHGLQTPIAAIKSELEFMRKHVDFSEHLDAFERSLDRVSRFIYSLLKLANIDAVAGGIRKQAANLSFVVSEHLEYLRVIAEEEGINLISSIEDGISIFCNKEQIGDLMTNLTSNAFKYTRASVKKEVSISLRRVDSNAIFEIKDTGCGINPGEKEKVFERFYRGSQTGSTIIDGAGLGLAIVKQITENHSGSVNIKSTVGYGTTVTVSLPLTVPRK